jgi:methionine synthase I (cobalamin-dependent)
MKQIAALGVNVVGGCCGTDPEFISKMHAGLADRFAPATVRGAAS